MSVELLPLSDERLDDFDDDGVMHVTCCDPLRSLCGLDFDQDDGVWPEDEETTCVVCADIESGGHGCGRRFCKLRRVARRLRG